MNPKKLVLGIGLLALTILPASAFAQEMFFVSTGGPIGFGAPPPFMLMLRKANLTDNQQKQLRQILETEHRRIEPLFRQLHSVHERISDKLLASGPVSANELEPLQRQATEIQENIQARQLDTALKIRALLTSAQLAKMAQVHEKLRSLHQQIEAILGPPGPPIVLPVNGSSAPMGPSPSDHPTGSQG
jgi:protein CpxP